LLVQIIFGGFNANSRFNRSAENKNKKKDLIFKKKRRRARSLQIWAGLGRLRPTSPHGVLQGRTGIARIERVFLDETETLIEVNPSSCGTERNSPGGVGGRRRWSGEMEAGRCRAAEVSWVRVCAPSLHAEDTEAVALLTSTPATLDANGDDSYGFT
jgi:hypothetical protein